MFDNLLEMMDIDPSFMLGAVRCVPLAGVTRDTIGKILLKEKSKVGCMSYHIMFYVV